MICGSTLGLQTAKKSKNRDTYQSLMYINSSYFVKIIINIIYFWDTAFIVTIIIIILIDLCKNML